MRCEVLCWGTCRWIQAGFAGCGSMVVWCPPAQHTTECGTYSSTAAAAHSLYMLSCVRGLIFDSILKQHLEDSFLVMFCPVRVLLMHCLDSFKSQKTTIQLLTKQALKSLTKLYLTKLQVVSCARSACLRNIFTSQLASKSPGPSIVLQYKTTFMLEGTNALSSPLSWICSSRHAQQLS